MDLQLVDPTVRPFDLDGELRAISRLGSEDVALVGLGPALFVALVRNDLVIAMERV
jgi:hypothetical protein